MAVFAPEIVDSDTYREWLASRTPKEAALLSERIVLRALPLIFSQAEEFGRVHLGIFQKLTLQTFLVVLLSSVVRKIPSEDNRSAATAAASNALEAAADAVALPSAKSSYFVARAAHASANSAVFAAGSTDFAAISAANFAAESADFAANSVANLVRFGVNADTIWEYVRADATALVSGFTHAATPLWIEMKVAGYVGEESRDWVQDYLRIAGSLPGFSPDGSDGRWRLWLEAYRRKLKHPDSWWFSEKFDEAIATRSTKWWERGDPNAVVEEIAEIIGWPPKVPRGELVFVSYSTADENWARWVAETLEAHGINSRAQYKDFGAGSNFVQEMKNGLDNARQMVALISPEYEASDHCQAEWNAFYNKDPTGRQRSLVPLLLRPTNQNSLAKQIVYERLYSLTEDAAAEKLLRAVGYEGPVTTLGRWPGGLNFDESRGAGTELFQTQLGDDGVLHRIVRQNHGEQILGFKPEQHFEDMRREASGLLDKLRRQEGNQFYSASLCERAANYDAAFGEAIESTNPLTLNRAMVWLLRQFAHDVNEGHLSQSDIIRNYAVDLRAFYKRLEHIYTELKPYREEEARDRFELPTTAESESIQAILNFFADDSLGISLLDDRLQADMQLAATSRASTYSSDEQSTDDLSEKAETEMDAANRHLELWGWITNVRRRMEQMGKSAEEIDKTVARFEKAYQRLSPHMERVLDYLSRWFF